MCATHDGSMLLRPDRAVSRQLDACPVIGSGLVMGFPEPDRLRPRAAKNGDDQRRHCYEKCPDHRRLHWPPAAMRDRRCRRQLLFPSYWVCGYMLPAFAAGASALAVSEMPRTASTAKIVFLIVGLLHALRPWRRRLVLTGLVPGRRSAIFPPSPTRHRQCGASAPPAE